MLKLIARPASAKEPDLLTGNEHKPFVVRDLADTAQLEIPATEKWTHEALELAAQSPAIDAFAKEHGGANAYLGDAWIGSTEV